QPRAVPSLDGGASANTDGDEGPGPVDALGPAVLDTQEGDAPLNNPHDATVEGGTCAGPTSQACGHCGTQTRTCDSGQWSAWSACTGEGACSSGMSQACGTGGTQSCGGDCKWGACGNQTCPGPSTQACGKCGTSTRTCDNATGTWSAWSPCA